MCRASLQFGSSQPEQQQARQIAFARLIDERAPVAKGIGGVGTLVRPQRIVVECALSARRPVVRKIEQKCQNSFHDTYLLFRYALPRRSDGRSGNTRLFASPCDRLLGP